jgi:hypothetical protein
MMPLFSNVLVNQLLSFALALMPIFLFVVAVYRLLFHGAIFIESPEEQTRTLEEIKRIVEADTNNTAFDPGGAK